MSKKAAEKYISKYGLPIVLMNKFDSEADGIDIIIDDMDSPLLISKDNDEFDMNGDNFTESSITHVEFGVINQYLFDSIKSEENYVNVQRHGTIYNNKVCYNLANFSNSRDYWFCGTINEIPDVEFMFQTRAYFDKSDRYRLEMVITSDKNIENDILEGLIAKIKIEAFNNSVFIGKCIEVKLHEGNFDGIEIIDFEDKGQELILNSEQEQALNHFIKRIRRDKTIRMLFNGVPGSGKTELIRRIVKSTTPQATYIIPKFTRIDDLKMILESCEKFTNGVVIMDDIDLCIGSRNERNYTAALGEFLNFFDGVKKRRISMLASTNDKTLVDEAAERPGRFNFIIDFDYLSSESIIKVCNIHLDAKWHIPEVYNALSGKIDGNTVKITGAFIANLAENIREMEIDSNEEDDEWTLNDTISLIKSSYRGFYNSQTKNRKAIGFNNEKNA